MQHLGRHCVCVCTVFPRRFPRWLASRVDCIGGVVLLVMRVLWRRRCDCAAADVCVCVVDELLVSGCVGGVGPQVGCTR